MGVVRKIVGQSWVRPFATLLFVIVLATVFSPTDLNDDLVFWKAKNLTNVLRQVSEIGVLAIGMTLVIVSGGIDLSVGSLLALSGVVFAYTFKESGWPLGIALAVSVGASSLFGLASGAVIARLRMQPFIVTLAAMIGSRGFARWLVDNANIDIGFGGGYIEEVVGFVAQKKVVVPTFFVVAAVGFLLLNLTRFGRYIRAVGGSEESAILSGVNVQWVKVRVYLLCGFFAGIAGVVHCCQTRQGSSNAGIAYELDAIAACVIGGCSLAGGKGGIFGAIVGTLALGILSNLLGLNRVDENVQWMLKAVIIIVAVWLQVVGTRKSA